MKHNKILALALLLVTALALHAQQMGPIPVDKDVRIGRLDNGLTYYLRHNNYPEHVADFYIAQKVGSINEDDDQRGLAHLLEHLAFNGSDHFKDNDLQKYLESIGVAYGRNLNAYTSVDQTVYYFTDVPTRRASAIDSCMLILKDWSNGITLSQKAIDDERDVVHNEYRMRMVGQMRILERVLPQLYPGSKYGYRMPIGLMSVVDGCKPETLRAYYHKWYRPDNQAIIVVGDIDVDHIEAEIKKLFGPITVPANAPKVVLESVPDNNEPIFVVDKDKEMNYDVFEIDLKHDPVPDSAKTDAAYLVHSYITEMVATMLSSRFDEKAQEPDCPYLQAGASYGDYLISRTKDAFSVSGMAKPDKMKEAYAAALTEIRRIHDYGFTATEYQRAKDEYLSVLEKAYTNRDKTKNATFTREYVDNFIENEPIPSIADNYEFFKMIVPNLPLEVVNAMAKNLTVLNDTNMVSLLMMREKDGATYPSVDDLKQIVAQVRTAQVTPYVDNVKQEPLIKEAPKAGKIVSVKEDKKLGFKVLTLSNGARVVTKKTDFKDDEVRFSAEADGGFTSFSQSEGCNVSMMDDIVNASGLGDFSSTEITKALAGKQVRLNTSLGQNYHGFTGLTTPKDLETLMQLIYLKLTSVKPDEKSFGNLVQTYMAMVQNVDNNPQLIFADSLQSTLFCGNKFVGLPSIDELKAIDYQHALSLYRQLYANAKDFTFYFVGNFNEDSLQSYVKTYLASLPAKGKSYKRKDFAYTHGQVKNNFTKAMENPQSQIVELWSTAPEARTLKKDIVCSIAAHMLNNNFEESIREKLSAAYYAGCSPSYYTNAAYKRGYGLRGIAGLNPDKAEQAVPKFFSGMEEVKSAPDSQELEKARQILLKEADVKAKENGYWMDILSDYVNEKFDGFTTYKQVLNSITVADVKNFLDHVLASGNHAEIYLKAVKK